MKISPLEYKPRTPTRNTKKTLLLIAPPNTHHPPSTLILGNCPWIQNKTKLNLNCFYLPFNYRYIRWPSRFCNANFSLYLSPSKRSFEKYNPRACIFGINYGKSPSLPFQPMHVIFDLYSGPNWLFWIK